MRIVLFEELTERHVRASLERALKAHGHAVLSTTPVWRERHLPSTRRDHVLCDAALDAALDFQPDVLVNFRPSALTVAAVARARRTGVTTIVWLSDDPVLYNPIYRWIVEAYDIVLNCGEAPVLDFYRRGHNVAGVNFPFWTDAVACPRQDAAKTYDIAFLGNCFGPVKSPRYEIISKLPGERRIYGQVDSDPLGICCGYEKCHERLMTELSSARLGFNVPQKFSDYRGDVLDFPELAQLGSFPLPSRVVQYAALGLPILSFGLREPPPWFSEMLTGVDAAECAGLAAALLCDEERREALGEAAHRRFQASYTASRRAAFLEWLVEGKWNWRGLDAAARARLYDRFDDPDASNALRPADNSVSTRMRRQASQLVLKAERPARILAFGATLNGPTDVVACHLRALRSLGHEVLHVDPFKRREVLEPRKIIGGGFGGNILEAARVREEADAFGADLILCLGGGIGFSPAGAERLREAGYVLVGVTLSDPDVQESVLEQARQFDVHFTNATLALDDYHREGLDQTFWMPFAVDRAWVSADLEPDPAYVADVICLGHAAGRPERNAAMSALAERFDRVRVYGRGWEIPSVGPVSGAALLQASRGGLLHVNFPRTGKGYTNVKCGIFESIGSGGILLTQPFDELARLFTYGKEIVAYEGIADLCEQVERLIADPDAREELQFNSMHRLLDEHLYEHRWVAAWQAIEACAGERLDRWRQRPPRSCPELVARDFELSAPAGTDEDAGTPPASPLVAKPELTLAECWEDMKVADLDLTPTPVSLAFRGPAFRRFELWLRVDADESEPANAAVVQIGIIGDPGGERNSDGHFSQQLGRFRYLPRPDSIGIARFQFDMPREGQIRLAFRSWRNVGSLKLSSRILATYA